MKGKHLLFNGLVLVGIGLGGLSYIPKPLEAATHYTITPVSIRGRWAT